MDIGIYVFAQFADFLPRLTESIITTESAPNRMRPQIFKKLGIDLTGELFKSRTEKQLAGFPEAPKQKKESLIGTPYKRLAATYFSTNKCSIIGDAGLNFSVRNGKR